MSHGRRKSTPPFRVLVLRAGSGASNNLIRALRAGCPDVEPVGCHNDVFTLRNSESPRNYLIVPPGHEGFVDALNRVIDREQIDLILPTTDDEVSAVSSVRDALHCTTFLPTHSTIQLCQDKYALTVRLDSAGVPVPRTVPVTALRAVDHVVAQLKPAGKLWCRLRTGTGSIGALPVTSAEQARNWMQYWEEMREVAVSEFTLAEYLPGRDFACQSVWKDGQPILLKTTERLAYFGGAGSPSGVSSIGGLHKTVREPQVADVCVRAVRAVDAAASGAFSVDLKQDARGRPCVTEINVGRFLTGSPIFDLTGQHSMTATYVDLALGLPVRIDDPYDAVNGHYMVRDLDSLPSIFAVDQLRDRMVDARTAKQDV